MVRKVFVGMLEAGARSSRVVFDSLEGSGEAESIRLFNEGRFAYVAYDLRIVGAKLRPLAPSEQEGLASLLAAYAVAAASSSEGRDAHKRELAVGAQLSPALCEVRDPDGTTHWSAEDMRVYAMALLASDDEDARAEGQALLAELGVDLDAEDEDVPPARLHFEELGRDDAADVERWSANHARLDDAIYA